MSKREYGLNVGDIWKPHGSRFFQVVATRAKTILFVREIKGISLFESNISNYKRTYPIVDSFVNEKEPIKVRTSSITELSTLVEGRHCRPLVKNREPEVEDVLNLTGTPATEQHKIQGLVEPPPNTLNALLKVHKDDTPDSISARIHSYIDDEVSGFLWNYKHMAVKGDVPAVVEFMRILLRRNITISFFFPVYEGENISFVRYRSYYYT